MTSHGEGLIWNRRRKVADLLRRGESSEAVMAALGITRRQLRGDVEAIAREQRAMVASIETDPVVWLEAHVAELARLRATTMDELAQNLASGPVHLAHRAARLLKRIGDDQLAARRKIERLMGDKQRIIGDR